MSRKTMAGSIDLEDFRQVFLKSGWRGVERTFGKARSVNLRLITAAGGDDLLAERARVQTTGRKAGGARLMVAA